MFKEMVSYYHELGTEICLSCSRVITLGLFEIHREHFISILTNKCQATKDRFLAKISDTYQNACKRFVRVPQRVPCWPVVGFSYNIKSIVSV